MKTLEEIELEAFAAVMAANDPSLHFMDHVKPPSKDPRNQTNEEWLADYESAGEV